MSQILYRGAPIGGAYSGNDIQALIAEATGNAKTGPALTLWILPDTAFDTARTHIRQRKQDCAFWVERCSRLAAQLSMRTTTNNPPGFLDARNTLRDMVEAAQSALLALETAQALQELADDLADK